MEELQVKYLLRYSSFCFLESSFPNNMMPQGGSHLHKLQQREGSLSGNCVTAIHDRHHKWSSYCSQNRILSFCVYASTHFLTMKYLTCQKRINFQRQHPMLPDLLLVIPEFSHYNLISVTIIYL